ncbi:MAG: hypothetical protein IPP15_05275 [Saprospiraceae bacterium]|uniref:Lipocalin-like domain-containing protein n=1 Tax=Candidatus Opimibacter skivensis TaxID=2982028 RepID=A0A9D7ST65_9BACT|nr:hypothetical protein [Candidatus Opimibacter skivensis]
MKSLLCTFLCLALIASSSCKKDDCVPGNLDTNIIGKWSIKALGQDLGDVEFHANGTLVDPDDALIGAESGGQVLDVKTFEVLSNVLVRVQAENADHSAAIAAEYDITSYTCDNVVMSVFGVEANMSRK